MAEDDSLVKKGGSTPEPPGGDQQVWWVLPMQINYNNVDVGEQCTIYDQNKTFSALTCRDGSLSDGVSHPIGTTLNFYIKYNKRYYPYSVDGTESGTITVELTSITPEYKNYLDTIKDRDNDDLYDIHDSRIPNIDSTPTTSSLNVVTSGGIKSYVDGLIPDVSNFITNSVNNLVNYYLKSETYTKSEVEGLIAAINQFHYEIAASTSAVSSPAANVLYLIGPTGSGADKYEEYVYASSTWTKIGDTSIDLSGYVTTQALNTALADYTTTANLTTLLAGKANVATTLAGYGITDANISNGVITLGSNTITPLTSFTETDPTVPSWAKASTKPTYNYSEIVNAPVIESLTTSEIDTIWSNAS